MPKRTKAVLSSMLLAAALAAAPARAQDKSSAMPHIEKNGNSFALMVDNAPFIMLGAQVHNSSAWPAMMPKVWPAIEYLHANTVEIPIYWEQLEPQQGTFDYSNVDMLLDQARTHHVHLVLLWFGTWKNGSSHYMPEWMKRSPDVYPNLIGKNGKIVDSPSPFCEPAMQADMKAFSALMGHLKEKDAEHTVLMVQVENEPGAWGSVRDFSPPAQKVFDQPVPAEVLQSMGKQSASNGNWKDAFAEEADLFFHAYAVAHYIQQVAAAGKAVYPLPMYVNVALRDPLAPSLPANYETGGANDNVIPIWKAVAPAIDVLAPDIYKNDSARVLKWIELYHRDDNPLFIPEIGSSPDYTRYLYSALANQAIGFSPFGLDYSTQPRNPAAASSATSRSNAGFDELSMEYLAIGPMDREIAKLSYEGKVRGGVEREDGSSPVFQFGSWDVHTTFGNLRPGYETGGATVSATRPADGSRPMGRVLVAQLGENEFIVTGFTCRVTFTPAGDAKGKAWQYLRVEEGNYDNGKFVPIRIWNGDETDWGLNFRTTDPVVLRVSVITR